MSTDEQQKRGGFGHVAQRSQLLGPSLSPREALDGPVAFHKNL